MGRTKSKQFLISIIAFISLIVYAYQFNWKTRDKIDEWIYDLRNQNHEIKNEKDLLEFITVSFNTIPYKNLNNEYLNYTTSNTQPFNQMLANSTYRIVKKQHLNQKIAFQLRVKNFMCKDKYYKELVLGQRDSIYWLIDETLLEKTIDLMHALKENGHNHKAFKLRNGHRHPLYNKMVGGASQSRHILGQAVDITVGDINNNGKIEQVDKQIILDLLENNIIKDQGGIGKYPGTMSVHYDTRGYKARWDSY